MRRPTASQSLHQEMRFNFTLSDVEGKKVSLGDFKGKVVVVDTGHLVCSCVKAIPSLSTLYGRRHSQGLEILRTQL